MGATAAQWLYCCCCWERALWHTLEGGAPSALSPLCRTSWSSPSRGNGLVLIPPVGVGNPMVLEPQLWTVPLSSFLNVKDHRTGSPSHFLTLLCFCISTVHCSNFFLYHCWTHKKSCRAEAKLFFSDPVHRRTSSTCIKLRVLQSLLHGDLLRLKYTVGSWGRQFHSPLC